MIFILIIPILLIDIISLFLLISCRILAHHYSSLFCFICSIFFLSSLSSLSSLECEREEALKALFYCDVQRWAGELMLVVYRALHTAVWATGIEGWCYCMLSLSLTFPFTFPVTLFIICMCTAKARRTTLIQVALVRSNDRCNHRYFLLLNDSPHNIFIVPNVPESKLYELFGTDGSSSKTDIINIPILTNSRKIALLATFEPISKGNQALPPFRMKYIILHANR